MILTCKNCKHCNDFGEVIEEGQEPCWSCLKARDYLPNHELIKQTNADAVNASIAHWIKGANDSGYIRCSKCGYNDVVERLDYYIYCPNCGARMVEDGE